MSKTPIDRLVALARDAGLLRPHELTDHGIARTYLTLAVERGLLNRVGRGLYAVPTASVTEHATLTVVCKRVPRGVICLLTALRFHEIGTQNPADVWLAVRSKDRRPKLDYPRLQVVRFSEQAMKEGIEERKICGVTVRVTNPARTVADCFKYRNKTGIDVAIEALRECMRQRMATPARILEYAKSDRILNVMRPYMEAMLG